jgi:hypothetical protein
LSDSLFEGDFRFPSAGFEFGRVEDASFQIAGANRSLQGGGGDAKGVSDYFQHASCVDLSACGYVVVAANLSFDCEEVSGCDIGDKDIVSDASAVARGFHGKYGDLLSLTEPSDEDRDDAGFAVWILTRAVDVSVAQDGVVEPVVLLIYFQVILKAGFASSVGTLGMGGPIFLGSLPRGDFAIDGAAGGGEHDAFDAYVASCVEGIDSADEIHGGVGEGFFDGDFDGSLGCLMREAGWTKRAKGFEDAVSIAQVNLEESDIAGDILSLSS